MFFSLMGKTFADFFSGVLTFMNWDALVSLLLRHFYLTLPAWSSSLFLSSNQPERRWLAQGHPKSFRAKCGSGTDWVVKMALLQDKLSGPCGTKQSYWGLALFSLAARSLPGQRLT